MLTVILYKLDGSTEFKDCWKIEDLSLVGVREFKIIRKGV